MVPGNNVLIFCNFFECSRGIIGFNLCLDLTHIIIIVVDVYNGSYFACFLNLVCRLYFFVSTFHLFNYASIVFLSFLKVLHEWMYHDVLDERASILITIKH